MLTAALALGSWQLAHDVRIDNDLSLFLPRAHDRDAAMLVEELRIGAGARTLLLGISGAPSTRLAELSRAMQESLRDNPRVARVANGSAAAPEALREWTLRHRYALVEPPAGGFTAAGLSRVLRARLADLAAGSSVMSPALTLRDPTAASLKALAGLAPPVQPPRRHGVWISEAGDEALMAVDLDDEVLASGHEGAFIDHLRARFSAFASGQERLEVSGPAAFAADARRTITFESRLLAITASVAVACVLFAVYRSVFAVVLAALPVATGVLAGTLVVSLLFGSVHGITLAFGVTVLGVAMDYPIHLFSHSAEAPEHAIDRIWPTLRLGLLSTVLGYCALLSSDFPGLSQLGVFAISGVAAAAAVTRWVLPPWLTRMPPRSRREPAPVRPVLMVGLALSTLALLAAAVLDPRPWLESDIAALSPVPDSSKALDRRLRRGLGIGEATHLLLIGGADIQQVLRRQERLLPVLAAARESGELTAYDAAARVLPSVELQRDRLSGLPEAELLRAALRQACAGLPLQAERFESFVDDVTRARGSPPLEPFTPATHILDRRLSPLLERRDDRWLGRVSLIGLSHPARVESRLEALDLPGIHFIDFRGTSSRMLQGFVQEGAVRVLWLGLAIAATLLLAQRRAALQVVPTTFAALVWTVAALHMLGEALSVFHITALLLVLGIGLDYGLFRTRIESQQERRHTLHAVRTCWWTTLVVFGLLALSRIPVLHAIGLTVTLGVSASYLASAVLVRTTGGPTERPATSNAVGPRDA